MWHGLILNLFYIAGILHIKLNKLRWKWSLIVILSNISDFLPQYLYIVNSIAYQWEIFLNELGFCLQFSKTNFRFHSDGLRGKPLMSTVGKWWRPQILCESSEASRTRGFEVMPPGIYIYTLSRLYNVHILQFTGKSKFQLLEHTSPTAPAVSPKSPLF